MVTIATWNLENLFLPGGDGPKDQPSYEAKLASLADTITAMEPDVLAVQEVGDPEALADLVTAAGSGWHTVTSQHPDSRGIRVGFLSRLPFEVVSDTKTLPVGLSPVQVGDSPAKPSAELGRGALAITVEPTPGVSITIITCHLKSKLLSFPGGRFSPKNEGERARFGAYALYRRAAEAVAVRELATGFLTAGGSVVVLGDLNDEVTAATTQILNGPTGSEIGTTGFDRPDGGDAQRLWNLAPCLPEDERFSRRFRGRGELIDHIFASHALLHSLPQVRTKITHELPSVTENPLARKGELGSDHAPVVATFEI
ncbi:Endonuclease/Exonuclease/phosphatase family protein [Lentzea waywayandensis]|uniref:Endonuclease/Exonuclease/phosphatase family protein n=1 Tax=Lentzea waywayandensis TaxID=84724 RepID=A0A1I6FK16_9PSEU|nr:endonuclease/exonuclease/phosphatase family protein [Lentzea waywayandensis]SFR30147.1 Endonuclease/Exonuclease/phosphatase family protein [Lentzea waywayandensis]